MKHTILAVIFLFLPLMAAAQGKEQTAEIIRRVNTYWQTNHPAEERAFWDNAAYYTGNIEVYRTLHDTAMLAYSTRWAEHNHWCGATEPDSMRWKYKNYGEGQDYVLFGDWQICFQTYIDLYCMERQQTGRTDGRKIARAQEVTSYEAASAATDYWWWCDALYMVMPVMTKMFRLTGDTAYLDKLYANLLYSDSLMLDPETGFYYRDARYVYPAHKTLHGDKDFWARGDGWVLAGLAKVLQDLPTDYRHYAFFLEKYMRLAKAVSEVQRPEGYWSRSLLDEAHAPGAETSGTAFFLYGILWGVNNGLLPQAMYQQTIDKAWAYLTTTALQPSGAVGYVQPIGDRAIPTQQIDAASESNFGVGAFLLAACAWYNFCAQ